MVKDTPLHVLIKLYEENEEAKRPLIADMIELLSGFCEDSLSKENLDGKLPQDLVVSRGLKQIMIECFEDDELFAKSARETTERKSPSSENENDGNI